MSSKRKTRQAQQAARLAKQQAQQAGPPPTPEQLALYFKGQILKRAKAAYELTTETLTIAENLPPDSDGVARATRVRLAEIQAEIAKYTTRATLEILEPMMAELTSFPASGSLPTADSAGAVVPPVLGGVSDEPPSVEPEYTSYN